MRGLDSNERVNVVTHAIGMLLSVVGAVVLIRCAVSSGDAWRVVGCSVYAGALVAAFTASTLSHVYAATRRRTFFRVLDQAIIYLLIVGTYTPFALTYLRTGWWLVFFLCLWTIALWGFFSKILYAHRVDSVALWIYVVLGWTPIVAAFPLQGLVPPVALWGMLIGGICYTVGTVFWILDVRELHFHGIWHLMVVAGSSFHFFTILYFVAPR